ncbi:hypothetical protein BT69DRAFT_773561 [Atractiella rhizophila]|nr:hypothetical protein BT69DRAFT_773561 [Atractiella rhizophila]
MWRDAGQILETFLRTVAGFLDDCSGRADDLFFHKTLTLLRRRGWSDTLSFPENKSNSFWTGLLTNDGIRLHRVSFTFFYWREPLNSIISLLVLCLAFYPRGNHRGIHYHVPFLLQQFVN